MKNKMRLMIFPALLVILFPALSHAHVKWFIDSENPSVSGSPAYSLSDAPVVIWIICGVAMLAVAIFLDTKLRAPEWVDKIVSDTKNRHDVMEILRVFTGISFLLTSYTGALVAPHLIPEGGVGTTLIFLQALAGVILISNRFIKSASVLIFLLMLGVLFQFGVVSVLEYINIIGIALFLLFNNFSSATLVERYKPYSVDMLRICTGLALVILGLTEKVHGAMFGLEFLENYAWNFMPLLGFGEFSDRLFVLSVGIMEIVLGIIIMLGVITRLTTITIAGFMLTSNIVFLIQGQNDEALIELVGHFPIVGTALVFIVLGYGQKIKITNYIGGK